MCCRNVSLTNSYKRIIHVRRRANRCLEVLRAAEACVLCQSFSKLPLPHKLCQFAAFIVALYFVQHALACLACAYASTPSAKVQIARVLDGVERLEQKAGGKQRTGRHEQENVVCACPCVCVCMRFIGTSPPTEQCTIPGSRVCIVKLRAKTGNRTKMCPGVLFVSFSECFPYVNLAISGVAFGVQGSEKTSYWWDLKTLDFARRLIEAD